MKKQTDSNSLGQPWPSDDSPAPNAEIDNIGIINIFGTQNWYSSLYYKANVSI